MSFASEQGESPAGTGSDLAQDSDSSARDQEIDEEQLRRILTCKRPSEGCIRFCVGRKNSMHLVMGEELEPVAEGVPMRHMSSHHLSQNIESVSGAGSGSSTTNPIMVNQKLTSRAGVPLGYIFKRHSQDNYDGASASCSSSNSLTDGTRSSPSRRRSSTASQCSSVLSESARQQLNFDLSPDLAPDSSLHEANALSPGPSADQLDLLERPDTPEPAQAPDISSSTGDSGQPSTPDDYDDASLDLRPGSCFLPNSGVQKGEVPLYRSEPICKNGLSQSAQEQDISDKFAALIRPKSVNGADIQRGLDRLTGNLGAVELINSSPDEPNDQQDSSRSKSATTTHRRWISVHSSPDPTDARYNHQSPVC